MHEERKLKDRGLSTEPASDGALAARHKTRDTTEETQVLWLPN